MPISIVPACPWSLSSGGFTSKTLSRASCSFGGVDGHSRLAARGGNAEGTGG